MTGLEFILWFKIIVTTLACSVPLLLLSQKHVTRLYQVGLEAAPLCRLYGIAVTALLIGYGSGIEPAAHGIFPTGVVAMGIFSNLGATATLIATGAWTRSPLVKALTVTFGTIALVLIAAMVTQDTFLTRVF